MSAAAEQRILWLWQPQTHKAIVARELKFSGSQNRYLTLGPSPFRKELAATQPAIGQRPASHAVSVGSRGGINQSASHVEDHVASARQAAKDQRTIDELRNEAKFEKLRQEVNDVSTQERHKAALAAKDAQTRLDKTIAAEEHKNERLRTEHAQARAIEAERLAQNKRELEQALQQKMAAVDARFNARQAKLEQEFRERAAASESAQEMAKLTTNYHRSLGDLKLEADKQVAKLERDYQLRDINATFERQLAEHKHSSAVDQIKLWHEQQRTATAEQHKIRQLEIEQQAAARLDEAARRHAAELHHQQLIHSSETAGFQQAQRDAHTAAELAKISNKAKDEAAQMQYNFQKALFKGELDFQRQLAHVAKERDTEARQAAERELIRDRDQRIAEARQQADVALIETNKRHEATIEKMASTAATKEAIAKEVKAIMDSADLRVSRLQAKLDKAETSKQRLELVTQEQRMTNDAEKQRIKLMLEEARLHLDQEKLRHQQRLDERRLELQERKTTPAAQPTSATQHLLTSLSTQAHNAVARVVDLWNSIRPTVTNAAEAERAENLVENLLLTRSHAPMPQADTNEALAQRTVYFQHMLDVAENLYHELQATQPPPPQSRALSPPPTSSMLGPPPSASRQPEETEAESSDIGSLGGDIGASEAPPPSDADTNVPKSEPEEGPPTSRTMSIDMGNVHVNVTEKLAQPEKPAVHPTDRLPTPTIGKVAPTELPQRMRSTRQQKRSEEHRLRREQAFNKRREIEPSTEKEDEEEDRPLTPPSEPRRTHVELLTPQDMAEAIGKEEEEEEADSELDE